MSFVIINYDNTSFPHIDVALEMASYTNVILKGMYILAQSS